MVNQAESNAKSVRATVSGEDLNIRIQELLRQLGTVSVVQEELGYNTQAFSEERVTELEQLKVDILSSKQNLQDINNALTEKINNFSLNNSLMQSKIINIDTLISNSSNFKKDNPVKISKILYAVNQDEILYLVIKYTGEYPDVNLLNSSINDPINDSINDIIEIDFANNEYLNKVEMYFKGPLPVNSKYIFYTTNQVIEIKPSNINFDEIQVVKYFSVNKNYKTWTEHENYATSRNKNLASIENEFELNKVIKLIKDHHLPTAWIGLNRISDNKRANNHKTNNWKWSDGSPWNNMYIKMNGLEEDFWAPNEPNYLKDEKYVHMYQSGKFNDLKNHPLPGIYSRKVEHNTRYNVFNASPNYQLILLNDKINEIPKKIINTELTDIANSLKEFVNDSSSSQEKEYLDAKIQKRQNNLKMGEYDETIISIDQEISTIQVLNNMPNAETEIETYQNINNNINIGYIGSVSNNVLNSIATSFKNLFGNSIKEGMPGGTGSSYNSPFIEYMNENLQKILALFNSELELTDNLRHDEHGKFMVELMAQKDNTLSNVLMDYMINENEGSTVQDVYNKLDHENVEKLRKIKINNYYTKTYKAYIRIVKIIVLATLMIIPIVILHRNELLQKNTTLSLVIVIIFLVALYIASKLLELYMKDDKDFDKINIPYDRQAAQMKKQGKFQYKNSPLKSLGITCIGDECCDGSMVYDNLRNVCVMQENFGNYFENNSECFKQQKSLIFPNNDSDSMQFTYFNNNFDQGQGISHGIGHLIEGFGDIDNDISGLATKEDIGNLYGREHLDTFANIESFVSNDIKNTKTSIIQKSLMNSSKERLNNDRVRL